ncbi:hypothetical protein Q5P01_007442 [Channa striata]|uniref:SEFIR domain-containing protein n=1 Tax=Channa striata TaxID=64152 RepID=A0AA88N8C5_CHASR|nr:hypothetical protein Q5P01_007442 [Channa striata]
MWGVTLMFFCYVASQPVTSDEIKVECEELDGKFNTSPSFLVDFKVSLLADGENYKLNLSWAIGIDASIQYLTGTLFTIDMEPPYLCKYKPELSKAVLTGSKEIWFHYILNANYGHNLIDAKNVPWPHIGSGSFTKTESIYVPRRHPQSRTKVTPTPEYLSTVRTTTSSLRAEYVTVVIVGGLTCIMILSSCYIIYKKFSGSIAKSFGFKTSTSPMVPIPVLMVYSAENSAFQQAVVALAEFLQWHGGCSVAVDMWQQGKIAELGPMRWLAEQVMAADRVLIVCPQPSLQTSCSASSHSLSQPSVPAAAHDLYPLILNMVGSHAKCAEKLEKFWVVQLGKQQDKRPGNLAVELRACKTFCLMKNLNKLCRSLHSQRQGKKAISDLFFRPGISYSENSTVKLKEAVRKLVRHQVSISSQMEPLQCLVNSV